MSSLIYLNVTNFIIAELERGAAPWVQPWKCGKRTGVTPMNAISGHQYRGINVPILWHAADVYGYLTNAWLTFKQAQEKGWLVKKGEKGTQVVFTKRITVKDEDDEKQISMLKTFYVFNVEQVEGIEAVLATPEEPPAGAVQSFITATGADIRHGGDNACFVSSRDFITLPNLRDFKSEEHYHATALHELTHWTGHETRLNRDLNKRFGTQAYAAEELIAELGSAFLCAHLGVMGELRHAGYIENWISLLKADNRAIFTAASKAAQAADYLRAFSETTEEAA